MACVSDPREAQRETDLHALFVARGELATAFAAVPDAALQYKGASDEYALSGIVVHLSATTDHYRRVVEGLIDREFKPFAIQPQDPGVEAAHAKRCQTGFAAGERGEALALLQAAPHHLPEALLPGQPPVHPRKTPAHYKAH